MCLDLDKQKTAEVKAWDKEEFTCWKMYRLSAEKNLVTPYFTHSPVEPGNIISNRSGRRVSRTNGDDYDSWGNLWEVNRGIHVFLYKQDAEKFARLDWPTARVVPVTCFKKDFVAAGIDGDAVFMKVNLSVKAWEKATGKKWEKK
jgi:hypothetical protein